MSLHGPTLPQDGSPQHQIISSEHLPQMSQRWEILSGETGCTMRLRGLQREQGLRSERPQQHKR
eukprot:4776417-Heterocapsa_arctica.AAC.1